MLRLLFSINFYFFILGSSVGAQASSRNSKAKSPSTSVQRTFKPATNDIEILHEQIKEHSIRLSEHLDKVSAKTVTLIMKSHTFEQFTRSKSCDLRPVFKAIDLEKIALELLKESPVPPLRLLGIRATRLIKRISGSIPTMLCEYRGKRESSQCPICLKELPKIFTVMRINQHIDTCLMNDV